MVPEQSPTISNEGERYPRKFYEGNPLAETIRHSIADVSPLPVGSEFRQYIRWVTDG